MISSKGIQGEVVVGNNRGQGLESGETGEIDLNIEAK